ncbi:MAG: hypothetical protein EOO86_08880 [Pedobacter sp.]|nr:MAG: hypothetical protein EOO86_08880 [Pedobacter sp.]
MKKAFIIISILCLGCQYKSAEKQEIISEEIQVILNTFEIAVTAVAENNFEDLKAEIRNIPYRKVNRMHKYTVKDSLLSMDSFKFSHYEKKGKHIKKTVGYDFKKIHTKKYSFKILKIDVKIAESDPDYNGHLTFSRVVFNKQRNRARYYFEQSKLIGMGRGWGMGVYIYAKKVNGIWVFDKEEDVWIA